MFAPALAPQVGMRFRHEPWFYAKVVAIRADGMIRLVVFCGGLFWLTPEEFQKKVAGAEIVPEGEPHVREPPRPGGAVPDLQ